MRRRHCLGGASACCGPFIHMRAIGHRRQCKVLPWPDPEQPNRRVQKPSRTPRMLRSVTRALKNELETAAAMRGVTSR
eukprot:6180177-Pyramimonas_sp.AAC.1